MPPLFLRQSLRSNYCGIYSTAMLLALLGYRFDRRSAFALFDLPAEPRNYSGATLDDIAAGFARVTRTTPSWRTLRCFSYRRLRSTLRRRCPTLVAYGAEYSGLRCVHVVVATAVEKDIVRLLDPLGLPPKNHHSNAVLHQDGSIESVSYTLLRRSALRVLRWT